MNNIFSFNFYSKHNNWIINNIFFKIGNYLVRHIISYYGFSLKNLHINLK